MNRNHYYSDEKNAQIVLALLKAHGIRKIIASPGTTNIAFVGSAQIDPFFEMYSAVDERHAAYMACGLSAESSEPVVISCTGATASRNYFPAITEAYYRHLPILAITSMHDFARSGHLCPQWVERGAFPADTFKMSISCPFVTTEKDAHDCELKVNKAILELTHRGGGPVHINLETTNSGSFKTNCLPPVHKVSRINLWSEQWPTMPEGNIAVWISSHKPMGRKLKDWIEKFSDKHDAVVLTDLTSSYGGRHSVGASILAAQKIRENPRYKNLMPNLIIHIGGVSGDYHTRDMLNSMAAVWRVSEDGDVVASLGTVDYIYEMPEEKFFEHYAEEGDKSCSANFSVAWENAVEDVRSNMPNLPFSNLWVAREFGKHLPDDSILHAAILSSLRSVNFMCDTTKIVGMANVGGFGIDGCLSSLLGASLAHPEKLHFIMTGDMAFFYDLNSIGNRHVNKNIRVLVMRNGMSGEMFMPISPGANLGEAAREFVCSAGHFGSGTSKLIEFYANGLGFEYHKAQSKEDFAHVIGDFVRKESDRPIILECFVSPEDEYAALVSAMSVRKYIPERKATDVIKGIIPQRVKSVIKAAIE